MGIVHASALFSAWRSFLAGGEEASSLAGCLALSISMVYFVLKVCGVTFLPFKPGRRGWVAAGLLVVMIHADWIRPGLNDVLASGYTDLLATAGFVGGVGRVPGIRYTTRRHPNRSVTARESIRWSVRAIDPEGFRPHCWVLAAHLYRLRAPPA
jgi:hypothetical protein